MPNISYVTSGKSFEVPENSNILRMSLRYDGELPNLCGGGICGSCVCKIEEGADKSGQGKKTRAKKAW